MHTMFCRKKAADTSYVGDGYSSCSRDSRHGRQYPQDDVQHDNNAADDGGDDLIGGEIPSCARTLLKTLEASLRGTLLGRIHSALCRARGTMPLDATVGPSPQPGTEWAVFGDTTRLLPCRLPPLPSWFADSEATVRRSRRSQRRLARRRLAWRWTEWQVAYFNACEWD